MSLTILDLINYSLKKASEFKVESLEAGDGSLFVKVTAKDKDSLVGIGDVGCVYDSVYDIAGDLWWNNESGTPVQITSGSSLVSCT